AAACPELTVGTRPACERNPVRRVLPEWHRLLLGAHGAHRRISERERSCKPHHTWRLRPGEMRRLHAQVSALHQYHRRFCGRLCVRMVHPEPKDGYRAECCCAPLPSLEAFVAAAPARMLAQLG